MYPVVKWSPAIPMKYTPSVRKLTKVYGPNNLLSRRL
jgi:hypothetical protein